MIRHVSARIARRGLLTGAAALLAAPAIVRAQQPRRFLRPLVAGLNGHQGDPTPGPLLFLVEPQRHAAPPVDPHATASGR